MPRVITNYQAFGIYRDEPVTNKALQVLRIGGTALATENVFDIGNFAGSFWGEAGGSVAGAACLRVLRDIALRAQQYTGASGLGLNNRSSVSVTTQTISGTVAATPAAAPVTATGLLTTDVITSVTQRVANANSLPLLGWNTQVANGITAVYSGAPGASGIVDITFRRSVGVQTPAAGEFIQLMDTTNVLVPNLTFRSGDTPTIFDLVFKWILKDGEQPLRVAS